MRQYPSIRVRIEGNCDQRGTQEYNLALGERRARAAYEYMVMLGVNPSQLEMISYGKERPAVQGSGEQAWSMNRRDDFRVIAR
ncbi:MAG: OmpA family protein, partial [Muribaculaceae bacterium]|nr:OmpA family protein [Muribaculaceae bacterium]